MASSNQQHSNPQVAAVLAFANTAAQRGTTYPSAAALVRAAVQARKVPNAPTTAAGLKALGRNVRQVARTAGMGCGRGHTYGQVAPGGKVATYMVQASRKAQAAAKAAAKAQAQAAKAQAPSVPQGTPQG